MVKIVAAISTAFVAGAMAKIGACEDKKRLAGMAWVQGDDVAGGEYSEWTMTNNACGSGPCNWNGAIFVDKTTCRINATFNLRGDSVIQLKDFQAVRIPAATLQAINWVEGGEIEGGEISGFMATMTSKEGLEILSGWYDNSGAVISYRSNITESGKPLNSKPWFWTPGQVTTQRQPQLLRGRILAQKPERTAALLTQKALECGAEYQRLRKSLDTTGGPYLVMRSGSCGRGHEWSGDLRFNDTTCAVTGSAGDITFAPFKPVDLPSATLSAMGLTQWKKEPIAGFQAHVQKGKDAGRMSGWYDRSSDTYLMFLSYENGSKEIIYWAYAN